MAREFWAGKPTTARVTGDAFYYVESPAEAAVEKMENAATFRDKVMFSWVALLRDPCCVEALTFRGQHAKDPDLRLTHLKAAVKAGFELWDPVWKEEGDRMTWWGFTATRPYMRAIQALGMEHLDRGDEAAARELFEILLEMNPDDNQGIRATLENIESAAAAPGM